MLVPAFIGVIDALGYFQARYLDRGGSPSQVGPTLARIIARDGVKDALGVLVRQHPAWESLDVRQPDIEEVTLAEGATAFGTPGCCARPFGENGFFGDGRFTNVPGFGIGLTAKGGESYPIQQINGRISLRERRLTFVDGAPSDAWGYLFEETSGVLHVIGYMDPALHAVLLGDPLSIIATIRPEESLTYDWARVEHI